MKKMLWRYWGYLVIALVGFAWFSKDTNLLLVLGLSGLSFLYMLFAAPMWCMAPNSTNNRTCDNNAHGLLIGCHLRKHKWEKMKMLIRREKWATLSRQVLSSFWVR